MSDDQQTVTEEQKKTIQGQEVDMVNGFACPVDPQERLECEACQ